MFFPIPVDARSFSFYPNSDLPTARPFVFSFFQESFRLIVPVSVVRVFKHAFQNVIRLVPELNVRVDIVGFFQTIYDGGNWKNSERNAPRMSGRIHLIRSRFQRSQGKLQQLRDAKDKH